MSVIKFCTFAHEKLNLKASSIKAYVSDLATVHKLRQLNEDFSSNYLVKLAIRGAENLDLIKGNVGRKRCAMSFPLLKIIGNEIAGSGWSKWNKQVFWAVCTVAFFGSCRMGELLGQDKESFDPLTTLLWKDISFNSDSVTIHIKSPKSRIFSGEYVDLFLIPGKSYCPFSAMLRLSKIASRPSMANLPVFMFDSGKLLTKAVFNTTVRALLRGKLGSGCNLISGHSFRQAIPTVLAKFPDLVKDNHIMGWGRWSSQAFLCYTKLKLCQKRCIFGKILNVLND